MSSKRFPGVPSVPPEGGRYPGRRLLGDRRRFRSGLACAAFRIARQARTQSELQRLVSASGVDVRSTSLQAALAVPSGREIRRRQRADHAHPPLLCRRHRPDPGAAVADRRETRRRQGRRGSAKTWLKRRRRFGARTSACNRRGGFTAKLGREDAREGQGHVPRPGPWPAEAREGGWRYRARTRQALALPDDPPSRDAARRSA
jgi:hypothetical protein